MFASKEKHAFGSISLGMFNENHSYVFSHISLNVHNLTVPISLTYIHTFVVTVDYLVFVG